MEGIGSKKLLIRICGKREKGEAILLQYCCVDGEKMVITFLSVIVVAMTGYTRGSKKDEGCSAVEKVDIAILEIKGLLTLG